MQLRCQFVPKNDLLRSISMSRKYFNESRYPHGDTLAYTKEFANMFLAYVDDVKKYIDCECVTDVDDN